MTDDKKKLLIVIAERDELRERVGELEQMREQLAKSTKYYFGLYNALREAVQTEHKAFDAWGCNQSWANKHTRWFKAREFVKSLLTESGGEMSGTHKVDSATDRPAPSSVVGQLLVRDGAPYRKPRSIAKRFRAWCADVDYQDPISGEYWYSLLDDDPADVPYKLAWEQLKRDAGEEAVSRIKTWNGLYEVVRVGDCVECAGKGITTIDPCDGSPVAIETCHTCYGDGGRYELRPADKGVDE